MGKNNQSQIIIFYKAIFYAERKQNYLISDFIYLEAQDEWHPKTFKVVCKKMFLVNNGKDKIVLAKISLPTYCRKQDLLVIVKFYKTKDL